MTTNTLTPRKEAALTRLEAAGILRKIRETPTEERVSSAYATRDPHILTLRSFDEDPRVISALLTNSEIRAQHLNVIAGVLLKSAIKKTAEFREIADTLLAKPGVSQERKQALYRKFHTAAYLWSFLRGTSQNAFASN
jgi:hypothetical protein